MRTTPRSGSRRARRRWGVVGLAGLLALGLAAPGAPAVADDPAGAGAAATRAPSGGYPGTAAVEGTVLGWFDPLGGATVTVYDAATGEALASQALDETVYEYRIEGLPPGDVKVGATRPGWVASFANNSPSLEQATVFRLIAGETLTQSWDPPVLYLDLTPGAVLEGEVVARGAPLAGATVDVLAAEGGAVLATTTSGTDGAFRLDGLAAGRVQVRATKAGYPTVLGPGDGPDLAGVYQLEPLLTVGPVVLDLTPADVLTGTVRGYSEVPGSEFDEPLTRAKVTVFDAASGAALASTRTDATGTYRFASLGARQVKVRATKAGYLTRFAHGRTSLATADVLTVEPGGALTVDPLALPAEAVVEGQVLSWMDPLGGAKVSVIDAGSGRVLRSVRLAEDVTEYRIGGLPAGRITVRATKDGYLPASAGPYSLVAGQTLRQSWDPQVLYLDLTPGAVLTGEVLGSSDAPDNAWDDPLPGVRVTVLDARTGRAVRTAVTDALGTYRVTGLAEGGYKVRASRPGWLTTFADQRSSFATADVIQARAGQEVAVPLLVLHAEAVLTGEIMGFSGEPAPVDDPLGGVRVVAIDTATGRVAGSTVTGDPEDPQGWGGFRIGGLRAGSYVLWATAPTWTTTWSHDQDSRATADVYTVVSGEHLAVPSPWAMLRRTTVRGQVLGDMDPLPGARVTVFDAATGQALRSTLADGDGRYEITVPTRHGGFAIQVRATKRGWYPSWADGRTTQATADVFRMPEGGTLSQSWDPVVLYLDLRPRSRS